jgi:class 3 adenylate cyclase
MSEPLYTERDRETLRRRLRAAGAGAAEIEEALRTATAGALALDLALRGPGESVALADAATAAGLSEDEAGAMWRALGFAAPDDLILSADEAQLLAGLVTLGREVVGEERLLGFARVLGGATGVLAEAVVDAFRIGIEAPELGAGAGYAEIVERFTELARTAFPVFVEGLGVLTRGHMVRTARGAWTTDEGRSAVTRDTTIGFADIVGYTGHSRGLSVTDLASAVGRFEADVADLVAQAGGRLVKFIGDAAMFAFDDPATGCRVALAVAERFADDPRLPPVRVGLACGPAVALHGDYYGEVVNLAARLAEAAAPSQVLVAAAVPERARDGFDFEPVAEMPLKGFDGTVAGFSLRAR